MKTILISGGTGLIGSALSQALLGRGYNVRHLSRNPRQNEHITSFRWSLVEKYIDPNAFVGVDVIIHLAGAPISPKRWSPERIKVLNESRSKTAELLYTELLKSGEKAETYISASGAHFYGAVTTDNIYSESDNAGNDIMAGITTDWELAANLFAEKCRVVKLRTPVVLSAKGGALPLMAVPAKLACASALGNGKQWMPWIHLTDLVNAYVLALENESMAGAYNVCAPDHVNNEQFMRQMSSALSRPFWAPKVPSWVLRTILGKQSVVLLEGSRIENAKICEAGMKFNYPDLESALISELS